MREQPSPENFESLLYAVAQALAHAAALLDALLVVFLQPTLMRVACAARQARGMDQAIEQHKLAVEIAFEDRLEIELDETRLGKADRVAQEPQRHPIGDDTPQRIGSIQIVLNQRV